MLTTVTAINGALKDVVVVAVVDVVVVAVVDVVAGVVAVAACD